jgi:hypothetical protein
MLKKLPVIIQLADSDVRELDLMKELHVDNFNLDRQLMRYTQRYGYWSQLYASASARVSKLKEDLENLEARLFVRYSDGSRVTDTKNRILANPEYQKLRKRLRKWTDAERHLKFAEHAFDKKLSALMCINATQRREKERA